MIKLIYWVKVVTKSWALVGINEQGINKQIIKCCVET